MILDVQAVARETLPVVDAGYQFHVKPQVNFFLLSVSRETCVLCFRMPAEPTPQLAASADSQRRESVGHWPPLLRQSLIAFLVIWFGITVSGALLGSFFLLLGSATGLILAGIAGGVPSGLAALLHVALRGRLPLRSVASLAGATAGVFSWGLLDQWAICSNPTGWLDQHRLQIYTDMWALLLLTANFASLGAVLAVCAASKILRGQGASSPHRRGSFSISELLLFTTWLAVVIAVCQQLVEPEFEGCYRDLMLVTIISSVMLVTEGLYRFAKWSRGEVLGQHCEDAMSAYQRRNEELLLAIAAGE